MEGGSPVASSRPLPGSPAASGVGGWKSTPSAAHCLLPYTSWWKSMGEMDLGWIL